MLLEKVLEPMVDGILSRGGYYGENRKQQMSGALNSDYEPTLFCFTSSRAKQKKR